MRKFTFFVLLSAALLLSSCGAYERLGYMQDFRVGEIYTSSQPAAEPHIYKNDKLRIVVTSSTPELAAPFNLISGVTAYDSATGQVALATNAEDVDGYTVDQNGDITFPLLGKIHVDGMTPVQLKETIEEMIKEKEYIKDPMVFVSFINFQITMLGELRSANLNIPSGGINILQALAMSNEITEDAQRDDIWVIRTRGDERELYSINLKTKRLYDSPAFYLQQNDVVYAKPKDSKRDVAFNNALGYFTTAFSLANIATTILLWLNLRQQ